MGGEKIPDALFPVQSDPDCACGTAVHAGMVARAVVKLFRFCSFHSLASVTRIRWSEETPAGLYLPVPGPVGLTVGARCGFVRSQCKGYSSSRESDFVLYTHAGPEITIATQRPAPTAGGPLYDCAMALVRRSDGEEDSIYGPSGCNSRL